MNFQALNFGLYIHIPFCSNTCDYCHFFKKIPSRSTIQQFLKKIAQEKEFWEPVWGERAFETIFWGGGSPSCLNVDDLYILGQLCPTSHILQEWTVEVSPLSINVNKLYALKSIGVNRISMGIQSFNKKILQQLGRHQTQQQVYQAYDAIRSTGFKNVNLDLIFSPDFSSIDIWQNDLQIALQLNPEHLSTYCLTYENEFGPFTPQAHQIIDEDREADFYIFTWDFLEAHGYRHYEVSNFAKPGFECRHNLNTWRMQEWIGWGPSAASQFNYKRFQNPNSLENIPVGCYMNVYPICEEDLCKDCLIFGLRMCQGIDLQQLQQRFPHIDLTAYYPLWQHFQNAGWVTLTDNILRCTPKGLLLADSLALEIL